MGDKYSRTVHAVIIIYSWLEVDVTDLHRPAIRDAAILRPARRTPLVGRRSPGTGSFWSRTARRASVPDDSDRFGIFPAWTLGRWWAGCPGVEAWRFACGRRATSTRRVCRVTTVLKFTEVQRGGYFIYLFPSPVCIRYVYNIRCTGTYVTFGGERLVLYLSVRLATARHRWYITLDTCPRTC